MGTIERAPEPKLKREQKIRTQIAIEEAKKILQVADTHASDSATASSYQREAIVFSKLEKHVNKFIKDNPNKAPTTDELVDLVKKELIEELEKSKKSKQKAGEVEELGALI